MNHNEPEGGLGFERIVFFSDAVFAIAITLLVLELRVPQIDLSSVPPDAQALYLSEQVPRLVGRLWPQLLAYFIGFAVLGIYWMSHHRRFGYIKRYDGRLIWLNLFLLQAIVFMPFPTALLGQYVQVPFAAVLYAATVAMAGILGGLGWLYATHNRRLVDPDLPDHVVKLEAARSFVGSAIFFASIPVAIWIHPAAAIIMWLAVFFIRPVVEAIFREG